MVAMNTQMTRGQKFLSYTLDFVEMVVILILIMGFPYCTSRMFFIASSTVYRLGLLKTLWPSILSSVLSLTLALRYWQKKHWRVRLNECLRQSFVAEFRVSFIIGFAFMILSIIVLYTRPFF